MSNGRTVEAKDIQFNEFWPVKHMNPMGLLPPTKEAAALWTFLTMAFSALDRVEKQATLEGDEDQQADLMQIAYATRIQFGLEDLNGMFGDNLVRFAKREAARCKLPWDTRIDAFFESGGKAYRHLDRDPDKTGQ